MLCPRDVFTFRTFLFHDIPVWVYSQLFSVFLTTLTHYIETFLLLADKLNVEDGALPLCEGIQSTPVCSS